MIGNGGIGYIVRILRSPTTVLSLPWPATVAFWIEGASGALAIFLTAFLLNQIVGRALLRLLRPAPMEWPPRLPKPAVETTLLSFRSERPGAFSFTLAELGPWGRRPRRREVVLVSDGLRSRLTDREFESVVAHELGHIHGLDGRYLTFFRTLARLVRWDPVLAGIARVLTRREEWRADDDAVALTGHPLTLARAIYKAAIEYSPAPSMGGVGFVGPGGPRGRREALARIHRLVLIAESRAVPDG